jgi:uncharacterized membrane protein
MGICRQGLIRLFLARFMAVNATAVIFLAIMAPLLEFSRSAAAPPVYWLLSLICHQIPSRSAFLWDSNMGDCLRCAAFYSALALGAALPMRATRNYLAQFCTRLPHPHPHWLHTAVAMFCILTLLGDGLLPLLGWPPSSNPRRLLTGALGGWAVSSLITRSWAR